ncbi:MAG TPA: hypothetical protein VG984_01110 [Candidatus Paceibacterota bacterium]|nr:hypothetical protein [Candidatus Paceibacterota bacterium]
MQLGIHPAALTYFEELGRYGIAYHNSMDFICFMDQTMVEKRIVDQRVEIWCPSYQLCLWRAFYENKIVGVQFQQPVARAIVWNRLLPKDALTLMDWANEGLEHWSLGAHSPYLPVSEKSVARAIDMHQQAQAFLKEHPDAVQIPAEVYTDMEATWKRWGSPSSGTH